MCVARADTEYFRSHKDIRAMLDQYEEHFGEPFPCFSYALFPYEGEKCSMQVYKETLGKALREDKPYEYPPDYDEDYF